MVKIIRDDFSAYFADFFFLEYSPVLKMKMLSSKDKKSHKNQHINYGCLFYVFII